MSIPQLVADLIARFVRNRDAYRSPAYNEAQARRELIDPFFRALGWDVDNEQGLAEAYKEVLREDAIILLVQHMLDLHKSLAAAKTAHEKTALQRQIDATDRQIDQLVYELYGLTEEEIRIVEEAT